MHSEGDGYFVCVCVCVCVCVVCVCVCVERGFYYTVVVD